MNIENFISTSLITILLIILLVYHWTVRTFDYWKRRNIPFVKPLPLFGNILPLLIKRENYHDSLKRIYDALDGHGFGGYFEMRQPMLLIRDPKLITDITVKNFNHFRDRRFDSLFLPELKELNPLSSTLFTSNGDRWSILRKKWSTTLTGSNLRIMSKEIEKCTDNLINYFEKKFKTSDTSTVTAEVHSLFMNYVIDVIGACILGLDLNCVATVADNKVPTLQKLAKRTFAEHNYFLRLFLMEIKVELLDLFRVRDHPKDVTDGFVSVATDAVTYRLSLMTNDKRNDFLKVLIDMQKDNPDILEIASNVFMFLMGGFESTGSTLCYCLYEMSFNPDVQEKVRAEILEVKRSCNGEKIDFEALKQLKYMDMVIDETLRMHTPFPAMYRVCTKDYQIPDTEAIIPKGTKLTIPLRPVHYNGDVFPDPGKFDPDRFSPENKSKITSGSYIPFGDGPRFCIGMRFAKLALKLALAEIISNYSVSCSPKTERPVKYLGGVPLFTPVNGIWLNFEKI